MTDTQPEPVTDESVIFKSAKDRDDANSITLMRILDVQYALLRHFDEKAMKKLADLHERGGLIGPDTRFDPSELLSNEEE